MSIKELYEKTVRDPELQAKFFAIVKSTAADGKEITTQKLIAFAKEAGCDIPAEEVETFVNELAEKQRAGELSEAELDLVAGGKTDQGVTEVAASVLTLGIYCLAVSINDDIDHGRGSCQLRFK